MKSEEFVELAKRTEPSREDYEKVKNRIATYHMIRLIHAGFGKVTEAAEFIDQLKKTLFYGKPLDEINLLEEIGDGFWYDAIAVDELKSSFPEVYEKIIAKLKARFGEKFNEEGAINRNLKNERKILEKE
jgi:NTP pyrophosphatase (non-canonical NTP hydrolase)